MRAAQSVNDHRAKSREGRRHRRIGTTMLVAGVVVLVVALTPTSANAVIPNSNLVPSGPATFNLSCTGNNDPTTDQILAGTVGNPVLLPATITADTIPSPADGEQFSLGFTWHITLPLPLVSLAIAFTQTLVQQNGQLPIHAFGGATGADAVGMPPPTTVDLGTGTAAITYDQGPFTGTFTRSGTGGMVQFTPGVTTTDSVTPAATLHLKCTPMQVTPLTLTDVSVGSPTTAGAAVVRANHWFLRNTNTSGVADVAFTYGNTGDTPIMGDWNGDGEQTPGVVRGITWFLRNSNSTGVADEVLQYGNPGDKVVVGDWNGDGVQSPGVVRGITWFLRNSNSTGVADVSFQYGNPGDTVVVGDWNGYAGASGGKQTPGVIRGIAWFVRNYNSTGVADEVFLYGNIGDTPLSWFHHP